jgi:CRP-like cAMP-binding protein
MKVTQQLPLFRNHLEKFVALTDDEFEQFLSFFTFKKLKKNQVLIREGDAVQNTHWVTKGLLISTFTDANGKEHIIQFANECCWVTDQQGFYNQTKAIFNIVALEDSELLTISFANREKLCESMHKAERFFRKKANDSFTKQQKRMLTYLTADAQQRYELLLEEYPQLVQRLSKKTLAAYLGLSRETMSRFKK